MPVAAPPTTTAPLETASPPRPGGPERAGSAPLPCRTAPADLFFAEDTELVLAAKALCARCPLRAPCLAGALARREPAGVWGGQLFVGGVAVAYKRGRGRPRKDAPALTPVL
ncbi:WhiB family transcriptional regulator [Kineococcus esterisolvens]|uniref:WhiB family transcriptional regulator n=1 Tax=unclassified Kineococcus TaxID=2621656 RepID=UPI003D7D41D2